MTSRLISNLTQNRNHRDRSLFNILLNGVPNPVGLRRHQRQTRTVVEKDFDLAYYKLEYHMTKLRDDLHPVCTADF